jgi:two-component system OmpR family response regulator
VSKGTLILIVDDDPDIREVVRFALAGAGMRTLEAKNGKEALELARREAPDLLVLDMMMPEMDGTDVCKAIRKEKYTPIVFMSSKDDEVDRILGLELGGDDYVTKPFSPRELVARIKAVLRRAQPSADVPANEEIQHKGLVLDLVRCEARWQDARIVLTATEFGVLRTLLRRPSKVFTRDELIDGAYGTEHVVSDRTVDSHIRRVRQKLENAGCDLIETVHGFGYKLRD